MAAEATWLRRAQVSARAWALLGPLEEARARASALARGLAASTQRVAVRVRAETTPWRSYWLLARTPAAERRRADPRR